jgi:RNA polymerase sigma-70 factor (ECF subfamily)
MRPLDDLVRDYDRLFYSLALRLCRNESDATDLLQDTYERVLRSIEKLPVLENEQRAWVRTILHRLFIDRYRARSRRSKATLPELPQHTSDDEPPVWSDITEAEVRGAMVALDDDFRAVFQRHALEGRSYREIAAELNIPVATVGSRLNRARRKLRDQLMRPAVSCRSKAA